MATAKKTEVKIKPDVTFVCGIELELEYNLSALGTISAAGYHSGGSPLFGEYFVSEADGSLYPKFFSSGSTAEIISFPFEIDNWKEILTGFKDEVERRAKEYNLKLPINKQKDVSLFELKDLICFNDTTGAHLHASFLRKTEKDSKSYSTSYKGRRFLYDAIPFQIKSVGTLHFFNGITNSIFQRIKTELPEVYPQFRKRFFRSYAKRNRTLNESGNRAMCWNLTAGDREQIEFRSFNLSGVTTWAQFFKMYEILFGELKNGFQKELSGTKRFVEKKKISIDQDDFSEICIKDKIVENDFETKIREKTIFLRG